MSINLEDMPEGTTHIGYLRSSGEPCTYPFHKYLENGDLAYWNGTAQRGWASYPRVYLGGLLLLRKVGTTTTTKTVFTGVNTTLHTPLKKGDHIVLKDLEQYTVSEDSGYTESTVEVLESFTRVGKARIMRVIPRREPQTAAVGQIKVLPSQLDTQVGGSHYKDTGIQPVEYNQANGLDFLQGSVIKYVSRHKTKNGIEDIKKGIQFMQFILELQYGVNSSIEYQEKPNETD